MAFQNPYRKDTDGEDFHIEDNGSIILMRPWTGAARQWIEDNLPEDRMEFGSATVVEPRYMTPIVEGLSADGLTWVLL